MEKSLYDLNFNFREKMKNLEKELQNNSFHKKKQNKINVLSLLLNLNVLFKHEQNECLKGNLIFRKQINEKDEQNKKLFMNTKIIRIKNIYQIKLK